MSQSSRTFPYQHYLVGGAVRDELMGQKANDRDYVVVGCTPEQLTALGFTAIGKDFPVFLHPKTHEEYALARTERKINAGYSGFSVHFSSDVTLEDDLARRDLTINAIAREVLDNGEYGSLVDPYKGESDIKNKILRHVSNAFIEDPVRILRLARFAARWHQFFVAPETMILMKKMVTQGETKALIAERVWQEIAKGLMESTPSRMFLVLHECGLLAQWLPEVHALFGVPQRADYHPEIDTGTHVMMVLDTAARMGLSLEARYAALCHDLGKGNTPAHILPRHSNHESRGVPLAAALSARLKTPRSCTDYARIFTPNHTTFYYLPEINVSTVINFFKKVDAVRRPKRFIELLKTAQADAHGRGGDFPNHPTPWFDAWQILLNILLNMDNRALINKWQKEPHRIPEILHQAQCKAITPVLTAWQKEQRITQP